MNFRESLERTTNSLERDVERKRARDEEQPTKTKKVKTSRRVVYIVTKDSVYGPTTGSFFASFPESSEDEVTKNIALKLT